MMEYNPRTELMPTQQSLLGEYEHQLNKEMEGNVAILSCLSQQESVGEQVSSQEIQQVLKRKKKNASKLVALPNFNKELLSIAAEQHWQLGAHVLSSSTNSEAEKQDGTRPKTELTSVEIANIRQQCAALLRQAVFNTVPGCSLNFRYNIISGVGSWHAQSSGGAAVTSSRHPNCKAVRRSSLWNQYDMHPPQWWGQCFPKNRDVLCGTRTS